jgi:DNA invertase Pin-like site-specific DNA recombinase
MLIGYGRTSTADQHAGIQAQERDLSAAGCDKLFIEQVSSIGNRQQLEAALDFVREGDTLIVTKLDRLARSVPDLLTIVARLEAKHVGLRVLAMSGGATARYLHRRWQAHAGGDRRCGAVRTGDDAGTPA